MQTKDTGNGGNVLLDAIIEKMNLKNDAALCRVLEVAPPVISKVRNRRTPVGSTLLIRIHEASGLPISELQSLMGRQPWKPKPISHDDMSNAA